MLRVYRIAPLLVCIVMLRQNIKVILLIPVHPKTKSKPRQNPKLQHQNNTSENNQSHTKSSKSPRKIPNINSPKHYHLHLTLSISCSNSYISSLPLHGKTRFDPKILLSLQIHHKVSVQRKRFLADGLRQEICMLKLRRHVSNRNLLPLYQFPDKVMPYINVLRV